MNHMDTIPESSSKDDTVQQPSDIVSPEISSNKKSKLTKSDVKSSETQSSKKLPTLQDNNVSSISQSDKSLGEPNKFLGEQNDIKMSKEKPPSSLLKKCALNDVPLKKKSKQNGNKMKVNSIIDQIDISNVINDSNAILPKSVSNNDNDMGPPKNIPRQLNKKKRNARISDSDDEIIKVSSKTNMKKDKIFEEKKIRIPQSKKTVKIQEGQNNDEMRSPVTAQILPRSMTKRRSLFCETSLDNDEVKKSHTSVSNDQSHIESEELPSGVGNKITPKISEKRKLFPRQIDNLTHSGRKNEDSFLTEDQQMDICGSISHNPKYSDTEDITEYSEVNSVTTDVGKVIRCECNNTNEFHLIVQCSFCKTWQHAACYGYYDDFIESGHCCIMCAKEDTSHQCSEPIIYKLSQNRYQSPDISVIKESEKSVSEIPLKSKSSLIMNHMDTIPESSSKNDTVQQPSDIVSPEIPSNKKSKLTKSDVKSSETQSSKKLPTLQDNNVSSISQSDKSLGEPNKSLDEPNKSLGEQNDREMSKEKLPLSLLKKWTLNDVPLKKKTKQNDNDMGPPKNVPRQLNKKKRNARISDSDDEIIKASSKTNMKKDEKFEEKKIRTPQSKKRVKIQEPVEQNNDEMRSPVTDQILPRSMTKRRSLFCETLLDNDKVKKFHTSVSNNQSRMESEELPSGADNKITPKISGKRKLLHRQTDNLTPSGRKNEDSFLTQDQQMGNSGSISHSKNADKEDITEYSEVSSVTTDVGEVIRCECNNTNEFHLIVQCSFCKTWQHAACYGYYDDFIESGHCCIMCAKEDTSRQCSEPVFYKLNQNRYQSPDISVIKESEKSVSEIPLKSKSNIMNHMGTIPESSSKDDTVQQPSDIVSPEIPSNKKPKLTKSDVKSSETQSSKKLPILQGGASALDENVRYIIVNDVLYKVLSVKGGGNCLFYSLSVLLYKNQDSNETLRKEIIQYIVENFEKYSDLLLAYDITSAKQYFEVYSKSNVYCGEIELTAIGEKYNKKIRLLRNDTCFDTYNQTGSSEWHIRFSGNVTQGHFEPLLPVKFPEFKDSRLDKKLSNDIIKTVKSLGLCDEVTILKNLSNNDWKLMRSSREKLKYLLKSLKVEEANTKNEETGVNIEENISVEKEWNANNEEKSGAHEVKKKSDPIEVKENADPIEVKENPDPIEVKENPDPIEVKENPDQIEVKEKSDPTEVKENPDPIKVKENADPIEVKENPDPIEVNENDDPIEVKENPDPIEVKENPDPIEVKENPDPIEVNENADPIEVKKNPDPIEVNENDDPIEVKENADPVEVKENPDPIEVNENDDPIEVKENPDPIEVKENPDPIEVKENPDPIEVKENPDPIKVNENDDPIEVKENADPVEVKENADPVEVKETDVRTGYKRKHDSENGKTNKKERK